MSATDRHPLVTHRRAHARVAPLRAPPADHVLVDASSPAMRLTTTDAQGRQLSPVEQADRILASLLNGSGPILLVVPGTHDHAYDNANLETAQSFIKAVHGPVSVAAIPYDNSTGMAIKRFFHVGEVKNGSVLRTVIRGLHRYAPDRSVYVVGESQGSWLIADELAQPDVAQYVRRAVLFSKPGFVHMPIGIGDAARGVAAGASGKAVANLPASDSGFMQVQHEDDIVPGLFGSLNGDRIRTLLHSLLQIPGHGFHYAPHSYLGDGAAAAAYLLTGRRDIDGPHPSSRHARPRP